MRTKLLVAMTASLLLPADAFAQGSAVLGQVRDSTLGTVPDVRVTMTGAGLSTPLTTLTADAGRYEFANVPDGVYDVVFDPSTAPSCPSFPHSRVTQRHVVVVAGVVTQIEVRLPTGPIDLTVESRADSRVADVTVWRSRADASQRALLAER